MSTSPAPDSSPGHASNRLDATPKPHAPGTCGHTDLTNNANCEPTGPVAEPGTGGVVDSDASQDGALDNGQLESELLRALRSQIGSHDYEQWFRSFRVTEVGDEAIACSAENALVSDRIRDHYLGHVKGALETIGFPGRRVSIQPHPRQAGMHPSLIDRPLIPPTVSGPDRPVDAQPRSIHPSIHPLSNGNGGESELPSRPESPRPDSLRRSGAAITETVRSLRSPSSDAAAGRHSPGSRPSGSRPSGSRPSGSSWSTSPASPNRTPPFSNPQRQTQPTMHERPIEGGDHKPQRDDLPMQGQPSSPIGSGPIGNSGPIGSGPIGSGPIGSGPIGSKLEWIGPGSKHRRDLEFRSGSDGGRFEAERSLHV